MSVRKKCYRSTTSCHSHNRACGCLPGHLCLYVCRYGCMDVWHVCLSVCLYVSVYAWIECRLLGMEEVFALQLASFGSGRESVEAYGAAWLATAHLRRNFLGLQRADAFLCRRGWASRSAWHRRPVQNGQDIEKTGGTHQRQRQRQPQPRRVEEMNSHFV